MGENGTGTSGHAPGTHLDSLAARRESLPAAAPGESLRAYAVRVAPILGKWLDQTRRWRRRAEWEVIRSAVETAYGDPVAQRTLETYLAAARKAVVTPPTQVSEKSTSSPPPPPLPAARGGRSGSQQPGSNRAHRYTAPRS